MPVHAGLLFAGEITLALCSVGLLRHFENIGAPLCPPWPLWLATHLANAVTTCACVLCGGGTFMGPFVLWIFVFFDYLFTLSIHLLNVVLFCILFLQLYLQAVPSANAGRDCYKFFLLPSTSGESLFCAVYISSTSCCMFALCFRLS